jgi:predicted  nucleic acid-binding Zn-ribbon protein
MATTIEYDIKEILTKEFGEIKEHLKKIDSRLESLEGKVTDLKVEMTTVKTEVSQLKSDVFDLKSSQKAQIWPLIVLAFTSVVGLFGIMGKLLFFS